MGPTSEPYINPKTALLAEKKSPQSPIDPTSRKGPRKKTVNPKAAILFWELRRAVCCAAPQSPPGAPDAGAPGPGLEASSRK